MNILIVAIHYPSASGRYIARAFRRLGHDVKTVGPSTGNQIWGIEVEDKHIWQPDIETSIEHSPHSPHVGRVLNTLSDTGWEPGLIVTADSAFTLQGDTVVPHIVYGVDNHVRDYQIGEWDYKFFAHSKGTRMDDSNTHWLPCAYDPEIHVNKTPFYERPMHGAMIAVMYTPRQELIEKLASEFRIVAGMGPLFEEYADNYNMALASICLSVAGDAAQRVFEAAAMGNIILSDRCHDFGKLGLVPGEHYLEYSNPDEAALQLQHLIDGPQERIAKMIELTSEWAKEHTWDARCQTILDTVFG